MRRLLLVAWVLLLAQPSLAADGELRLEGVAYTERPANEVRVQVWALGDQVTEQPEWQVEAVFDGVVSPGKGFAVDLGEALLPVSVEISAKNHVAVALQVVVPEQLSMPPAWLRAGEHLGVQVNRPGRGDEKVLIWGRFWVDEWGWDGRRWRVVVPHLEVPAQGGVEVFRPPTAEAVWLSGIDGSGAFGTARERLGASTGRVRLKIDSAPMKVRVWDARKWPVEGVELRELSSPVDAVAVSDDEGRAEIQVPATEEWRIFGLTGESQGLRAGRGVPQREVDLDLEPRENIELRWPEELGTIVVDPGRPQAPTTLTPGAASLPAAAVSRSLEFWGPGIAPGRMRIGDTTGPLPVPAKAAVRIEGRVEAEAGVELSGLPVWIRISRSALSPSQYFSRGMRATPLERPWLPWAVTDRSGRFSVAGLPPGACDVEVRAPGFPAARSERLDGAPGAVLDAVVRLRAGAGLGLRVVDPENVPLPGATVDLYRSASGSRGSSMVIAMGHRGGRGDPEMSVAADEDGQAYLASAPVGAVRLRLSRPGSVSRTIDPVEVPPEGVDLGDQVLEPGITLTGTTVGPDGEPVGDAEVALERGPQTPFLRPATTSGEDGRFSIADLEPTGEVYLQARAEGLVPEAPLKVELPPVTEIEVAMAEERVLEGMVLDGRNDAPVEGVSINLMYHRDMSIPGSRSFGQSNLRAGSSQTDASGRFLLEGLWAGEFELHVSAESMRPVQQKIGIGAADPEPVVVRLDPGLELRGRVETADGEPAPGLTVIASPASRSLGSGSADSSRVQSDANGRFYFDTLGPGTQQLQTRSEDGMSARATAEGGQAEEVVLRFARGGSIRGTVFDPNGAPFAGARVRAFGRGAYQSIGDESGADGRFELTGAGPGAWTVGASAEGYAPASEDLELPEGESITVDLRLTSGATVVGEIRGLRGAELETCRVQVESGGSARPSGDGSFRIDGVAAGETQVVAFELTTRRSRSIGVIVPETGESAPVVINFAAGLAVSGRVLRGNTGVPGLVVTVNGVAAAASGETVSGPDGGWRVEGLDPGEYQIAALSSAGEVLAGDHVLLESSAEIDLYLASGSIRGRVLEADTGQPIEGASVTITGASLPPVRRSVATGAGGAFEVFDLDDGDYAVRAESRGRMPGQRSVTITDAASVEAELSLEDDQTTVFVVTGADGAYASGIWIQALAGGVLAPMVSSNCREGGRCEVRDFPRGRWTLLIYGEGMALMTAEIPGGEIPVRLRAQGTLEIKARADDSGGAWQVRLSDAANGLVVPVNEYDNPGRGEWVPVPAAGFTQRLPEGAWRIETFAPDGTQGFQQATVTAGGTTVVQLEK